MIFNNRGECVSRARDTFSRTYLNAIKPDRDASHLRVRHFAVCVTRMRDVHVIANKYANEPTRIMCNDLKFTKGCRENGLKLIKMHLSQTHPFYVELIAYINDELSMYEGV